jgi:hypothetical protein
MEKKGVAVEGLQDILIWVVFIIIAAVVVWLLIKRLSA